MLTEAPELSNKNARNSLQYIELLTSMQQDSLPERAPSLELKIRGQDYELAWDALHNNLSEYGSILKKGQYRDRKTA